MEHGEDRHQSGSGPRIVRVGTHALKDSSQTTLWTRLSQHRGQASSGGGNHRGSIFRLIVGKAIIARNGYTYPTWGDGNNAPPGVRASEHRLEQEVSAIIGAMPFFHLAVDDPPGPRSQRGYIERNAIALLSNFGREAFDPPSEGWLGSFSDRDRVRRSGLWNSNHVEENHDSGFLKCLEQIVAAQERGLC